MVKAVESSTRILIEFGYGGKFMLPGGTSADTMAVLANAIHVDDVRHKGKYVFCPKTDDSKIKISIVAEKDVCHFVDSRGDSDHQEYDIIVAEVTERLGNKPHGPIIFRSSDIYIGTEAIEYEDLADPDTDPETIIEKIVQAALANPIKV